MPKAANRRPHAPARLVWAVDSLALKPADHVLEIGCGTGVAASLVCEKLTRGKLVAIDRSATAISAARKHNREHVKNGRASFVTASVSAAKLDGTRFNKVFGFNVGSLRKEGSTELAALAKVLKPKGELHMFEQPPAASMTAQVAEGWLRALRTNGFVVRDVVFHELEPAPVVSVVAAKGED